MVRRYAAIDNADWEGCPAVERTPGKVSGAWVFAGTRIPLHALYENLACGATIDEFVEWFPAWKDCKCALCSNTKPNP